ncbi:MAG: PEP/pyruvate-binding domain-containing protein [Promethearchaeota archaeon]
MEFIVFLTEGTPNLRLLGGKGSNLIKLVKMKANINIPPGFIINTNSFKKFLEESEYRDQLVELLSKNFIPKNILSHSKKIKDLILASKLPRKIINEIKVAFEKLCTKFDCKLDFAVRSSATVEDCNEYSFAGQADTFLCNKTFDEILKSLKNCWASLYSPRAMLYLLQMRKKGIDISFLDIHMAIVVQKMVNSHISGVLFTTNVINNDENQMLINSSWGLGETIADNSIIPDTIVIKKNKFELIKRIIGKKEKKSIQNPKGSHTIRVETKPKSRTVCSLNEKHIRQLHELGLKIEDAFNFPQDIEWAIENNDLFVLQSRPITTLRK